MCSSMPSRTVSLEVSAYDRLKAAKRAGESFSQVVNRVLESSRPSFRDLSGVLTKSDALGVQKAIEEMRKRESAAESEHMVRLGGGRRGPHRRD